MTAHSPSLMLHHQNRLYVNAEPNHGRSKNQIIDLSKIKPC